uniref:Uncharacterized protein n=1 Tax=Photobacterium damselae subsp. damselae TaxID=85581 RepID=H1A9T0_PHODD|nr:hypothetical protein [Photobacterium damselae subsp. damselae]
MGRCPKPRVRHVAGVQVAAPLRSALPAPLPERGGHSITSRVRFAGCSPDPFRFAPGLRLPLPPLTLPERPSLWLWGWERRERSDRRPQPPSLTAASVGSPEGQSPFGPSAAETNPLASGEALTPRERSAEESPNDFDKNHKFKVDAHLVM